MAEPRVLVIAPHADDETLGMGGTIARKIADGCIVQVAVMTGPGEGNHPLWSPETWDTIRAECREAVGELGSPQLRFANLPAACMDTHPAHQTNAEVARVIEDFAPNEVYLPYYHDLHQDHRAICYAGIVATRGYLASARSGIELVAMYETLSETGLMPPALQTPFAPNFFVDVSAHFDRKLAAWNAYRSQHLDAETPRDPAVITALGRLRGAEIGVEFAEAFQIIRLIAPDHHHDASQVSPATGTTLPS